MSLELQVKQEVGLLNWNFEELNHQLDLELKRFEGVVISEEQISEAKKARANLNNLSKVINDRKIQVKNEFCAPYLKFESQVKILIEKIKEASSGIDKQVKTFEEKEKQERQVNILRYFETINFNLVPLNKIFDEKWLNKTCTEKQWQEQLSAKVEGIKVDLAIIQQMEVENKQELKEIYLDCLNISKAKNEYDFRVERRAKLKASEEQNRRDEQQVVKIKNEKEELYTRAFRVVGCTKQQIIDLGNWMNQHGVKFEKIEEGK